MKIYLIRHGQTNWNLDKRWQGAQDISLNETGIHQAHQIGNRLQNIYFEKIYTSPLSRAFKTAQIIQQYHPCTLEAISDLKEIYLGSWEGQTISDILKTDPERFYLWETNSEFFTDEHIESYTSLQNRACKTLKLLINSNSQDFLIVTHGAWIRALLCFVLHISLNNRMQFEMDNVSLNILTYNAQDENYTVSTLNDTAHLE